MHRLVGRLRRLGHRGPLIIPDIETTFDDKGPNDATDGACFTALSSFEQYITYAREYATLLRDRAHLESTLIAPSEYFSVAGYCAVCRRDTAFKVDFLYSAGGQGDKRVPNWRERLVCRHCKLPNGVRAMFDFMESALGLKQFDCVPFVLDSRETLVRARVDAQGRVEHLHAPEYHGDPINPEGVLCYYHFGWDLLDSLTRAAFLDASLNFYWSCRRGYLGGLQFLMSAKKLSADHLTELNQT